MNQPDNNILLKAKYICNGHPNANSTNGGLNISDIKQLLNNLNTTFTSSMTRNILVEKLCDKLKTLEAAAVAVNAAPVNAAPVNAVAAVGVIGKIKPKLKHKVIPIPIDLLSCTRLQLQTKINNTVDLLMNDSKFERLNTILSHGGYWDDYFFTASLLEMIDSLPHLCTIYKNEFLDKFSQKLVYNNHDNALIILTVMCRYIISGQLALNKFHLINIQKDLCKHFIVTSKELPAFAIMVNALDSIPPVLSININNFDVTILENIYLSPVKCIVKYMELYRVNNPNEATNTSTSLEIDDLTTLINNMSDEINIQDTAKIWLISQIRIYKNNNNIDTIKWYNLLHHLSNKYKLSDLLKLLTNKNIDKIHKQNAINAIIPSFTKPIKIDYKYTDYPEFDDIYEILHSNDIITGHEIDINGIKLYNTVNKNLKDTFLAKLNINTALISKNTTDLYQNEQEYENRLKKTNNSRLAQNKDYKPKTSGQKLHQRCIITGGKYPKLVEQISNICQTITVPINIDLPICPFSKITAVNPDNFILNRKNIWDSFINSCKTYKLTADGYNILVPIKISFMNEMGDDVGGIRREAMILLGQELISRGILIQADTEDLPAPKCNLPAPEQPIENETKRELSGYLTLNPRVSSDNLFGLANALWLSYHTKAPLEIPLASSFIFTIIHGILDRLEIPEEILLALLKTDYPDKFNQFMNAINNPENFAYVPATSTVDAKILLKMGGDEITPDNIFEWVNTYSYYTMFGQRLSALNKLVANKYLIDLKDTMIENQICIADLRKAWWSGVPDKDIVKKSFEILSDKPLSKAEKDILKWMTSMIDMLNADELTTLIFFWTGGYTVPKKLNIQINSSGQQSLPVAHTCSVTIDIPLYKTEKNLVERFKKVITISIESGNALGFELV